MNFKAVFFDFGDTLVALSPAKEELFVNAARTIGVELGLDTVKRAYQIVDFHNKFSSVLGMVREDFYRNYNAQLCEALGISSYCDKLQPALTAQFKQHQGWQLIPDAAAVLDRLYQRGVPLALVANWDSNLPDVAEKLGIKRFFDNIVPSQSAGVEKPDPAIFAIALKQLSLSSQADQVLYIGNEYRADVLGARVAGLVPVLIDKDGVYPHADCLRFASLREWLEST
jgi:putative hydrolase of the HAD superfamily